MAFFCLVFGEDESPEINLTPTPESLPAREFLDLLNAEVAEWQNRVTLASWAYESNLTDENQREQIRVSSEFAAYTKAKWPEITAFPWQQIEDYEIKRQFSKHVRLGLTALPKQVMSHDYLQLCYDTYSSHASSDHTAVYAA